MALISGTSLADQLFDNSPADTIYGGGAGDSIEALGEGNRIYADLYPDGLLDRHDGGNDTIRAGAGNVVMAGDGDDHVWAGVHSTLRGGSGNDTLETGGDGVFHAGRGDDVVSTNGPCTVDGGAGRDRLLLNDYDSRVQGGQGRDFIVTGGIVHTDDRDAATPAQGGDWVLVPEYALRSGSAVMYDVRDFLPGAGGDVLSLAQVLDCMRDLAAYDGINPLLDRARLAQDGARVVQSGDGMLGGDSWLRLREADGDVQVQLDRSGHGLYVTVAVLRGVSLAQLTPDNFDPPFDFTGAAAAGSTGETSAAADWVFLLEGNDSVHGGGGDDQIHTSRGNDVVHGGRGNDRIDGGDGDDSLAGGEGGDFIEGGAGRDTLRGGAGSDDLTGEGDDTLYGNAGNDWLTIWDRSGDAGELRTALLDGGAGDDWIVIQNEAGSSTLRGGAGRDHLEVNLDGPDAGTGLYMEGGNGDDYIRAMYGGAGTVLGGRGNDYVMVRGEGLAIDAGAGADTILVMPSFTVANRITTGAGADALVLYLDPNPDPIPHPHLDIAGPATVITDFNPEPGHDRLDLTQVFLLPGMAGLDDPFAAGVLRFTAFAHGTRVEIDADGSANGAQFQPVLVLQGVAPQSLGDDLLPRPMQPVIVDNPALPQAQDGMLLLPAGDTAPVALALGAAVDPDGGTVSITVWKAPAHGQLLLDGEALAWWEHPTLTVEQLMRLQFQPDADALGPLGSLTCLITDDEGSTIACSLSIDAAPMTAEPLPDLASITSSARAHGLFDDFPAHAFDDGDFGGVVVSDGTVGGMGTSQGSGQDTLLGGAGPDFLHGSGNDTLRGLEDDDQLVVDDYFPYDVPARAALLEGGWGADWLYIPNVPGHSTLLGGGGDDTLQAGSTIDGFGWDGTVLDGGGGNDAIYAYACNGATVRGGQGDDTIMAYGDGMVVKGGRGDDFIKAVVDHLGGNRITTGGGADVVELESWVSPYGRASVVTDFKAGAGGDRIDLDMLYLKPLLQHGGDPFAVGVLRLTAWGAHGTRVELDADGSAHGASFQTALLLQGVTPESLTADNFVQPVQPLLSGNAAVPRAQADKTIVLDEDAAPVALGLSAPLDPDGGTVSITVYSTPYGGQVLLDGHAVSSGSLTADELARLQFKPDADAHGPDSFVYLVTDDEGSTVARNLSFQVDAVDDDAPTLPHLASEYLRADTPDDPLVLDLDEVAQDPDSGDGLQFSFTTDGQPGLPGWLQYDAATHVLSGSLPYQGLASATIGVTVTDPTGLQASDSFVLRRAGDGRLIQGAPYGDSLLGGSAGDQLVGTEGNDRLDGRAGNDTLRGGYGSDTLIGGDGEDRLQGDSGQDHFRFAGTGVSTVVDFDRTQDVLELDHAVFQALGALGPVDAGVFTAGRAAQDADDRLLYNRAGGGLYYDADGTGPVAAVLVAKLTPYMALSAADLFVV